MKSFKNIALTLMFAGVVLIPAASAHAATSIEDMLTQIQALMTQIENLQKQLATIKGEVKSIIRDGIAEGMTGEDIAKLQELLATDPVIYPEGKKTGYFGPLTKEAVKRFQMRHELEVTGVIDDETHDLLEEYLHEGFGDRIPPGLLNAPGIMKKVEMRYQLKCEGKDGKHGMGPLCKKLKVKYQGEDTDDSDDDDSSSDKYDVEVEIEDGETTVTFKWDGVTEEVTVDSTNWDDVHDAVKDELDVTELEYWLKKEIQNELEEELADEEDDEAADFEVEVEIESGSTTVEFVWDGDDYTVEVDSTEEDDVLDAVADAIDEDDTAEDLDEDLADEIRKELEDAIDEVENDEAEEDADDAIDDAKDAIDDAEAAIDASDDDTTTAEALLEDANEKLDDAEDAFEDEDYEDAEDFADDARKLAEDAEDAA